MKKNNFYLKQLQIGPMENFIYLIGDKNKKECVMIDPAWDVASVLQTAAAEGMKVVGALATHHHYDHTNGIADLLARQGCPIYIHKDDAPYLKGMQKELTKVASGHTLQVGDVTITFIHTPGHTPGSQCFLVNNHLVSGDTLFIGACGRCDFPGGDAAQMYHSLQKLGALPDSTLLFPGHNYAEEPVSTIGQEKQLNPYYQVTSLQDFLDRRMG